MAYSSESAVSFGKQLQTKGGSEAVERLADEEIRLLENIRLHLTKRVKADLDYATALTRVNQVAMRTDKDDASPLAKAWTSFASQSDAVAQRITEHARHMSATTLECLDKLIREKRNAKRKYASERRRIEASNNRVAEEVEKLKKNYRDNAKETESQKKKYEEMLQKKAKTKDVDRTRDKYVRWAGRLHACHNDYVFATMEANYQQQASRDRVMPQLLDAQQELQEYYVEDWKEIIQDYHEQTQYCRDDFVECYSAIQQSIDDVQKGLQYVTFVKQNSSDPAPFIPFEFDSQIVDLTTTNVQAGELVLNNLTVEILRDKQEACQNKLEECHTTLGYRLDELEKVKDEEDDPDTEADVQRSLIVNRLQRQRDLEREIEELKCTESKLQAHEELLLKVLEPLGEDDAPPFADNVYLGAPSPTQTVGDAQPTGNMVGGHTTEGKEGNYLDVQHNQSRGAAKSMGKKFGLKFRKLMGRAKKDSQGEPDVNSAFSPAKDKGDSSSESYEEPPERRTEDELWYHGEMGRKEAENMCLRDGDYLVRVSGQRGYVLTTKSMSMPKHFIIQTDDEGLFRFEDQAFVTVSELLSHHASTGTCVTKKSGVTIKRPVKRKQASLDLSKGLSHDSVLMGARLGKGNFGDVYKAKLKHNNQEVAVKTCRSENFGDAEKFLKEAQILAQYDHQNIVKLIGICSEKEPIYIVMELMLGGDFLTFLRKKGHGCSPKQLTEFGMQAAAGMEYLEGKNCIHRDLAARNCLIGANEIVLKISDFGMSREEDDGIYTVSSGMKQIPIKWTAPEALNYGTYTSLCDVWSFGVLLWESFSCGSAPYPGQSNRECRERVEVGYRMPAPDGTPAEVYDVMMKCWEYEPDNRPNFVKVHKMLEDIVVKMK